MQNKCRRYSIAQSESFTETTSRKGVLRVFGGTRHNRVALHRTRRGKVFVSAGHLVLFHADAGDQADLMAGEDYFRALLRIAQAAYRQGRRDAKEGTISDSDRSKDSRNPDVACSLIGDDGGFQWAFHCKYCKRDHYHGAGDDRKKVDAFLFHRGAHCAKETPYKTSGYMLTKEVATNAK